VAIKPAKSFPDLSKVWLVECKVARKYFRPKERKALIAMAKKIGAKPKLAYRVGSKLILEDVG